MQAGWQPVPAARVPAPLWSSRYGKGLGTLIAVLCSWSVNHSVLWAIIAGFFGWIYVIYYLIAY